MTAVKHLSTILTWLALPFILLAMVVVPLFGGHFCPQEAAIALGVAGGLPFIGPLVRRALARWHGHSRSHCCEPNHTWMQSQVEKAHKQAKESQP